MIDREIQRIAKDIKDIKIQGASKIELAAVNGIKEHISKSKLEGNDFLGDVVKNINHLISQRPNEPKLRNSLSYIWHMANKYPSMTNRDVLIDYIEHYERNTKKGNDLIAEYSAQLITNGSRILTHCHSNLVEMAFKKAYDNGIDFEVICTETRPKYQGRITAKALCEYGIKTTQIVDSSVASYLKKTDLFLTGADVVLHNGSIMNKIGTHTISIAAKHFKTPHIVLTSTHCIETDIFVSLNETVEERDTDEVWKAEDGRPKNLVLKNPSFDITPSELIDKFITEEGVFSPETLAIWNRKNQK
ncbi:MAG TPA: S-methyl-5-thioribose-1-phosphate isomerase [Candidatus Diapherotrites archaeon]|nr:S-methyl-5-thioribose-1-phosphate isomerase [Candidatus Diapherotrites archaeon]